MLVAAAAVDAVEAAGRKTGAEMATHGTRRTGEEHLSSLSSSSSSSADAILCLLLTHVSSTNSETPIDESTLKIIDLTKHKTAVKIMSRTNSLFRHFTVKTK